MIEIRNLFKKFDHQTLFKGLHLDVTKGSVVALIGPSGGGKSTLLRCINGLESFQEGCISVDGQTIYGVHEQSYNTVQQELIVKNIRKKVGMVFQQFNLFPHMTVLQNITEAPINVLGVNRTEVE